MILPRPGLLRGNGICVSSTESCSCFKDVSSIPLISSILLLLLLLKISALMVFDSVSSEIYKYFNF